MRTTGIPLTVLFVLFSVTAYSGVAHAQIPDEVEIGTLLPLSGRLSSFGTELDHAANLAVADFNRYLEHIGADWRMHLVVEDTETNPVRALEKTQALHSRGIDLILGPAGSAQLSSILAYLDSNNMVAISPSSTTPTLAIPNDSVFRLVPDDLNQGTAIGALLEHSGVVALVPMWRGEVYGDGLANAALANFESRGGVVYDGIRYNPEISDFSVSVAELADTVADAVGEHGADKTAVLLIAFDESVPILQAAATHDALDDVRWFGGEAIAQSELIIDDVIASDFAVDTHLTTIQLLLDPGERADSIATHIQEQLGHSPTPFAYTTYDAVWLMGLSVLESDGVDAAGIRAVMRDVAASYSGGALSSTELNEAGDLVLANYETWYVNNNVWIRGGAYDSALDSIIPYGVTGPVAVGSLLPLTGEYSSVGVEVDAATQLAIDDFNAYLKEKGAEWNFVLFREDSASNPVVSLEKIQSLHSRGADIVFGPAGSARVSSVKGYVDTNNMLVLSCCSTAPSLSIPGDRIFRTVADDLNQGLALGKVMMSSGIDVIIPLWIGDTYGDGLRNAAVDDFESRGGVSDEGIRYNPDSVEFSVTVAELAERVRSAVDAHEAERVGVLVVAFDEIVPIMQTASTYDILGDVRWFGSETIAQSKPIADDRLALQFSEDVEFTAVQLLLSTGQRAQYVSDSLAAQLGNSPNAFVYTGYDAVWLVGLSIEQAGSADPADIAMALPTVAANYKMGALDTTELNANGDLATANYEVWGIDGGVWVQDSIYDIAQDAILSPTAIVVDGTEFEPAYSIQGGVVQKMYTDPQADMLIIDIISDDDGVLDITLSRDLVDAQTADGDDSSFFVFVDDAEVAYVESDTASHSRTLKVEFPAGSTQIDIVGTSVAVPEFGGISMLVLAAGLVATAAFSLRYRLVLGSALPRIN